MDQEAEVIELNGWKLTRDACSPGRGSALPGSTRLKAAEALSRFAEAEKFRSAAQLHDEAQQAIEPRLDALQSRPGMQISLRTGRIVSSAATDSAAMEIALVCSLSQGQGHRILDQAETLVMDTPEVLESLALGRIGTSHVQRILEHTAHILPETPAKPPQDAAEAVKEEFERTVASAAARARADRRDFGADMLAIAPGKCPSQLRARGRQVLEKYYGQSFTRRSRTAARERRIILEEARDGMTWLSGYLPTASCQAIFSKVDAMAQLLKTDPEMAAAVSEAAAQASHDTNTTTGAATTRNRDTTEGKAPAGQETDDPVEQRTMDQLRADIFTDMLLDGPRGQGLETVDAQVFVAIPATMLPGTPGGPTQADRTPTDGTNTSNHNGGYGTDGQAAVPQVTVREPARAVPSGPIGSIPADLDDPGGLAVAALPPGSPVPTVLGGGPIDQESAARLMLAAKTWWRVITDPLTGAVVEFGQNRYRPTPAQRAILHFRDGSCTTPGCTGPAARCEIDHTREWQHGGGTDIGNLRLGCKRCHRLKSLGLLEVEQRAGGTILVTSLFGTRRVGYPAAPWAVADPGRASLATETAEMRAGRAAPPADPDAVIPEAELPRTVPPQQSDPAASGIQEPFQALQLPEWGRIQDVPDPSSDDPQHGRYARSNRAKAVRKRRLKRNTGAYGPPTIHRPDDRDNPPPPRSAAPDEPPF
ncbi:DUF222 domain-containing protein [Arthrobacter rhombi]|uniref:DUF222 domain-containing protein n=1 Tax=Arthrobacter rhombi TaxID=71253 RepID=UPI003FD1FB67